MKNRSPFLPGALALCALVLFAAPARAGQYPITIAAPGASVSATVYAPQNQAIRMSVTIPQGQTKHYALEDAASYEFRLSFCGKTHVVRWNRSGAGVVVTVRGCDDFGIAGR